LRANRPVSLIIFKVYLLDLL